MRTKLTLKRKIFLITLILRIYNEAIEERIIDKESHFWVVKYGMCYVYDMICSGNYYCVIGELPKWCDKYDGTRDENKGLVPELYELVPELQLVSKTVEGYRDRNFWFVVGKLEPRKTALELTLKLLQSKL